MHSFRCRPCTGYRAAIAARGTESLRSQDQTSGAAAIIRMVCVGSGSQSTAHHKMFAEEPAEESSSDESEEEIKFCTESHRIKNQDKK